MRHKRIAVIALQETKLSEKDTKIIEKENLELIIESNPSNRKAGTAFVINKDIVKWDTEENKPWKHEILEKGKIAKMQLEYSDYTLTIINVYMPNTQSEKAELIENLRTHLENKQERDNILIAGDFNLVTNEQDRLPPHLDDTRLVDSWTAIETKNDLIDGWRLIHENKRQFTYKQSNSLERIDRIYTTRYLLKNCLEWTIESNYGISNHQIVTVKIMKQNTSHIGKGLWKLSEEIIKWPPYVNRVRKLLLEMANKMKLKKDKMINI